MRDVALGIVAATIIGATSVAGILATRDNDQNATYTVHCKPYAVDVTIHHSRVAPAYDMFNAACGGPDGWTIKRQS